MEGIRFSSKVYDRAHHRFADDLAHTYDLVEDKIGTRIFVRWENDVVANLVGGLVDHAINGTARPIVVVDIGCGTGRFSETLLSRFPQLQMVAVDFSLNMLVQALAKDKIQRTEYRQGLAENLPLEDESCDVALHGFGVTSYSITRRSIPEVFRVLRPGGRAVFTTYNADGVNLAVAGLVSPAMAATLDLDSRKLMVNGSSINCMALNPIQLKHLLEGLGFTQIRTATFPILSAMLSEPSLLALVPKDVDRDPALACAEEWLFQMECNVVNHPIFKDKGMYVVATAKKPE